MQPDWARNLRDQCRDTGAAFFLKTDVEAIGDPCRPDGAEYPSL